MSEDDAPPESNTGQGAAAPPGALTRELLIVNKRGQTTVLTGLQDALSIEQAIDEARDS